MAKFILIALALVAVALAQEPDYPPVYPKYSYSYAVADHETGDDKHQSEERDGDVVTGEYSLLQPDGLVRTVQYRADSERGFEAVVSNRAAGAPVRAVPAPALVPIAIAKSPVVTAASSDVAVVAKDEKIKVPASTTKFVAPVIPAHYGPYYGHNPYFYQGGAYPYHAGYHAGHGYPYHGYPYGHNSLYRFRQPYYHY